MDGGEHAPLRGAPSCSRARARVPRAQEQLRVPDISEPASARRGQPAGSPPCASSAAPRPARPPIPPTHRKMPTHGRATWTRRSGLWCAIRGRSVARGGHTIWRAHRAGSPIRRRPAEIASVGAIALAGFTLARALHDLDGQLDGTPNVSARVARKRRTVDFGRRALKRKRPQGASVSPAPSYAEPLHSGSSPSEPFGWEPSPAWAPAAQAMRHATTGWRRVGLARAPTLARYPGTMDAR